MNRSSAFQGIVLFLSSVVGLAQQTATFDSTTRLVLVDVSVADPRSGLPVGGLQASDFAILDRTDPRPVAVFDSKLLPLDVILLIDASGRSAGRQRPTDVRTAVSATVRELRPGDRLAVASFSSETTVHLDLTDDEDAAVEAIREAAQAGRVGDAKLLYAVTTGAGLFEGPRTSDHRRVIVLVTHNQEKPSDGAVQATSAAVLESGASVVAMVVPLTKAVIAGTTRGLGIGIPGFPPIIRESRRESQATTLPEGGAADAIVKATGGELLRPKDFEGEIGLAFDRLRSSYLLGFYVPKTVEGEFRPIQISLTDEARERVGDVRVRHRSGYTLRADSADRQK